MTIQATIVRVLDGIVILAVTAVLIEWGTGDRRAGEGTATSVDSTALQGVAVRPELVGRGAHIALPNVEWHDGVRNVVLLASASCPACNDSIGLYRSLGDYAREVPELRFVIAAADDVDTVRAWADTHGVQYDVLVDLRGAVSLGFTLTPTLLLIDDIGVVTDILLRRLSPDEESMLWERLRRPDSISPLSNTRYTAEIDEAEFQDLIVKEGKRVVVIDVRSRFDYQVSRAGRVGINIPIDELAIRGAVELMGRPEAETVVVDCTAIHWVQCRRAGRSLETMGVEDVALLLPQ